MAHDADNSSPETDQGGVVARFPLERARPPRQPPLAARRKVNLASVLRSLALADAAAAAAISAGLLAADVSGDLMEASLRQAAPFAAVAFCVCLGVRLADGYVVDARLTLAGHLARVGCGIVIGLLAAAGITALADPSAFAGPHAPAAAALAGAVILAAHVHAFTLLAGWRRQGRLAADAVLVGATARAQKIIEEGRASGDLNVVAIFEDRRARAPRRICDVPVLGTVDDLLAWRRLPEIDRIVVTVNPAAAERVRLLLDRLRVLPQDVAFLLDLEDMAGGEAELARLAAQPAAYVGGAPRALRDASWKRLEDLLIGTVAFIALAPLFAAIAVAVRFDSPGPVFFRQRRHGFNNRVFQVWKFRTMAHEPDGHEPMRQVEPDDPRVTRIGGFLRRTSLDELPQLLNVLAGDMSLVGPRPHAVDMRVDQRETASLVAEYARRHRVKPGMTGWAQINGSRGPLRDGEDVARRVALDLDYVDRATFWFDLKIMVRTIPIVLAEGRRAR